MDIETLACECSGSTRQKFSNNYCNSRDKPVFRVKNICNKHRELWKIPQNNSNMKQHTLYFFECGCSIIMIYYYDGDEYGGNCTPTELFGSFKCDHHQDLERVYIDFNKELKILEEKYKKLLEMEQAPIKQKIKELKNDNPCPLNPNDPKYESAKPPIKTFKFSS